MPPCRPGYSPADMIDGRGLSVQVEPVLERDQQEPERKLADEQPATPEIPERYRQVLDLIKQGKRGIAEKQARTMLAETPEDGDTMALLASIVVERGEFDEAERLLKRALQITPMEPTPGSILAGSSSSGALGRCAHAL